jgi:pimeloyl-ACP methyl ester carboxylesterase
VVKCLAQLDADPRQYVTPIAIEDLDEVRAALGYPRLNLWAGSYGTRVALEYVRRHRDHVRTIVLDGVAPATMKLPLSFASDGDAALEAPHRGLRDRGAVQQGLSGPARAHQLDALAARAPARARDHRRPAYRRPRRHPGERERLPLGALPAALRGRAREPAAARHLGRGLGDFNPLLAQNLELADDIAENLAIGMHLSVICAEDVPRITRADLDAAGSSFFGRALVDDFLRACRTWPRGKVPDDYYEPVSSNVPALILSGGIDPATPPRHGDEVARTLRTRATSWRPSWARREPARLRAAPDRVVRARGQRRGLDGKCLQRIPRPLFVMPWE